MTDRRHSVIGELVTRLGIGWATLLVTLVSVLASVVVAFAASGLISIQLMPTLVLAIVTPAVVAPPVSFFLLRLYHQLRRAEMMIEQRDRLSRELFHRAPALIHSLDPHGTILDVSSAWLERLGYSEEEVIGRCYLDFLTEDSRVSSASSFPAFKREGRISDLRLQFVAKSGEIVEMLVAAASATNEKGEFDYSISVLTDITDLLTAQSALEESESKFRSVIERAGDAFMLHDQDGNFTEVNESACRSLGYSREELLAKKVQEVEVGLSPAMLADYWDRMVLGEPITLNGRHRRKDGSEFPVEVRLGVVEIGGGYQMLALARDMTERRQADERQRRQEAELAHLLRNRSMSEMAGWLAHELNQPLAACAAFIQGSLIRLKIIGNSDPDILEALDKAHAQSQRAGEIIKRLRNFVGRSGVNFTPTNFTEAVQEAVAMMRHEATQRNIEIIVEPDGEPLIVRADPVQLQQVVINLLRNGIDAIEESGNEAKDKRRITIACRRRTDGLVEASIRDTGTGISGEMREVIFDRFQSTKNQGMGMGLAICRSILESIGGTIRLHESDQTGTEFRIRLPLAGAEEPAIPDEPGEANASETVRMA